MKTLFLNFLQHRYYTRVTMAVLVMVAFTAGWFGSKPSLPAPRKVVAVQESQGVPPSPNIRYTVGKWTPLNVNQENTTVNIWLYEYDDAKYIYFVRNGQIFVIKHTKP